MNPAGLPGGQVRISCANTQSSDALFLAEVGRLQPPARRGREIGESRRRRTELPAQRAFCPMADWVIFRFTLPVFHVPLNGSTLCYQWRRRNRKWPVCCPEQELPSVFLARVGAVRVAPRTRRGQRAHGGVDDPPTPAGGYHWSSARPPEMRHFARLERRVNPEPARRRPIAFWHDHPSIDRGG